MIGGVFMKEELDKIFREILYLDDNYKIDDNLSPGDIVEWDSLSHMNLIYELSNRYNINITFKDLRNIKNWGQLKDYVIKKSAKDN